MGSELLWGLAASLLRKGLKCKPLRTGCPQQFPGAHCPSPKQVQQHPSSHSCSQTHAGGHWAKQEWPGQTGGWVSSQGQHGARPGGQQPHPGSPVRRREAGQQVLLKDSSVWSTQLLPSRFKPAHPAALSWLQLQPHWAGVSLLTLIYGKHKVA